MPALDPRPPASLGLPGGWYLVGRSADLKPGALVTKRLFGRDVILFRTASGRFAASDPWCPHLGAHLGHGGCVDGETIRCPFHGFRFDADGPCVHTPYDDDRLPKIALGIWPTQEQGGLLLAWFDPDGRAPWFDVPQLHLDGAPPFVTKTYRLRSHPQEISENAVDAGHFTVLHGYSEVTIREDVDIDGPVLVAHYALKRDASLFGRVGTFIETSFDAHLHGLGVNLIHSEAENFGLATRIVVFQTPTDDGHIDLTLAITVLLRDPAKLHWLAAWLPRSWAHWLVQRAAMLGFQHDVSQDRVMWDNKAYLPTPGIAAGDGPIGRYRVWARQFYGEAA